MRRDLAARNCLVSGTETAFTVKVADFGLSRALRGSDYYVLQNAADILLPIRWMAPECLIDFVLSYVGHVGALRAVFD